ncbi:hypothetical protein PVAP13_2KG217200 [Panicum virgatum]|uniref:Uncharacterized protein n=1 Tax=Panicum virgatum TaxID=38727 RepID=A0A8T0W3F8_PANVG|nr:hypothetical protein PVAP13_2KG217200 [Panicum virgatum]
MPVGSPCTPAISKPCHTGSNLSSPSPAVSPRPPHSDGRTEAELTKRPYHIDDQTPAKKLKSSLGFDISPAPAPEATPDPKSFLKVSFTPSNKFEAPQPGCEPSSGLVELPLTIANKHLAQCLVLDIVHVTEEGIDPAGNVLYGQLINEPYDKIIAPVPRTRQLSWSPALRHR